MTIDTKFNIGDLVWFLNCQTNKIDSKKIEGFKIQVGYFKNSGEAKDPFYVLQLENDYVINGSEVFKTKELLVENLLKK